MSYCVVKGCKFRRNNKRKKQIDYETRSGDIISFHRLPNNPEIRDKWLQLIGQKEISAEKRKVVCSVHFADEAWVVKGTDEIIGKLRKDAYPIYKSYMRPKLDIKSAKVPEPIRTITTETICEATLSEIINQPVYLEILGTVNPNADPHSSEDNNLFQLKRSPHELKILSQLELARSKIKKLRQKIRRQDTKIKKFQNEIAIAKDENAFEQEWSDLTSCVGDGAAALLKRLISPIEEPYNPDILSFASTIFSFSPEAYDFIRNEFCSCLPSPMKVCRGKSVYDSYPNGESCEVNAFVQSPVT